MNESDGVLIVVDLLEGINKVVKIMIDDGSIEIMFRIYLREYVWRAASPWT